MASNPSPVARRLGSLSVEGRDSSPQIRRISFEEKNIKAAVRDGSPKLQRSGSSFRLASAAQTETTLHHLRAAGAEEGETNMYDKLDNWKTLDSKVDVDGFIEEQDDDSPERKPKQEKRKKRLSISGAFTETGEKPENQDSWVIEEPIGDQEGCAFFAVFDGHGEHGKAVADFVKDRLPANLAQEAKLVEAPEVALRNAFLKTDQELCAEPIDTTFSGAAATTVLIVNQMLYIANCGDSRTVLGQSKSNARSNEMQLDAVAMSTDHKPNLPSEKKRVEAAGGRVEAVRVNNRPRGPQRVFEKEGWRPGLAMSRSLGDEAAHAVGVIAEPEIRQHELAEKDKVLVLATDGVWDLISNQKAVDSAMQKVNAPEEASADLVHLGLEAQARAGRADNVTALVIFLQL